MTNEEDTPTIQDLAQSQGIMGPYALSQKCGLSYPTARELWNGTTKRPRRSRIVGELADVLNVKPDQVIQSLKRTGAM